MTTITPSLSGQRPQNDRTRASSLWRRQPGVIVRLVGEQMQLNRHAAARAQFKLNIYEPGKWEEQFEPTATVF
ncbi:hypothetical protein [Bradyrhizobium sp.]|uniref:hypothetical protein n=1 Tax=Bradyrhizobium sp. TaxID=376 RepID=UPI0012E76B7C|nr:hypothetical protein [Bradyrhizobium sp.]